MEKLDEESATKFINALIKSVQTLCHGYLDFHNGIEIIGHIARVLSLTFRLFGNMAGHELVLMILFALAGAFFAPLPIMALGIFVAFVQAFVFFLLSIIYFSGSIEHAH